jgi:hypothetical protein
MFWFKKKKAVLTVYTDDKNLIDMFPPVEAKLNMPSYYKTMPAMVKKPGLPKEIAELPDNAFQMGATVRHCYGMNKFNQNGFIFPLWADYSIVIKEKEIHTFAASAQSVSLHKNEQAPGLLDPYHIVKFDSPWVFSCNKDIQFAFLQNFYATNSDLFSTPPGVLDFYNQHTSNIFVLVNKQQTNKELLFKAGCPLIRLLPLTTEDIELKVEYVDNINSLKKPPVRYFFANGLSRMIKAKNDTKERKCPFNF